MTQEFLPYPAGRVLAAALTGFFTILLACRVTVPGGEFPPTTPTPSEPTPTPVILGFERTPEVRPTNTPVSRPATPTPRPSPTPVPVTLPATPTTEAAPPTGQAVPPTTQAEAAASTGQAETAVPPSPTPAAAGPAPLPSTEMVQIPAGSFTMGYNGGLPDEQPEHPVDLPAFQIDIFEVTNAQFAAFAEATGYQTEAEQAGAKRTWRSDYGEGEDNVPVVRVSWGDAAAYCQAVGKRLPTEAEWEKAARGPENWLYPWGNNYDPTAANGKESGLRGPVNVGSYGQGASGYGVFDLAGNVWEWTDSWYQPYPGGGGENPYYGETYRVLRGGGWFNSEAELRATRRSASLPSAANDDIGFRCAQ